MWDFSSPPPPPPFKSLMNRFCDSHLGINKNSSVCIRRSQFIDEVSGGNSWGQSHFDGRLLGLSFWEWPYKGLTPNGPLEHKAFFQKEAWNFYDPAASKHINLSLWRSAGAGPHHSIKELCDPIDLKYLKQGWSSKQFLFYTITQSLCVLALKHLLSVPLCCLTLESVTREQSSFIWNKLDSPFFFCPFPFFSILYDLYFMCQET